MKVTSGKDLKLTKSVSIVVHSDSDNNEESTEFEEKAESDPLLS
jgi:hypothetical protein